MYTSCVPHVSRKNIVSKKNVQETYRTREYHPTEVLPLIKQLATGTNASVL